MGRSPGVSKQDKVSEDIHHGYKRDRSWQELCHAALEAKDPNELQEMVQELNKALKHEEQVRRDFREAATATSSSGELHS